MTDARPCEHFLPKEIVRGEAGCHPSPPHPPTSLQLLRPSNTRCTHLTCAACVLRDRRRVCVGVGGGGCTGSLAPGRSACDSRHVAPCVAPWVAGNNLVTTFTRLNPKSLQSLIDAHYIPLSGNVSVRHGQEGLFTIRSSVGCQGSSPASYPQHLAPNQAPAVQCTRLPPPFLGVFPGGALRTRSRFCT